LGYFSHLEEDELPKYVIVSDFAMFRIYDLDADKSEELELNQLPSKLDVFDFIPEHRRIDYGVEDPVNIRAAEEMARLHDALERNGYIGHDLEILLVRMVFCLFADHAGIFEKNKFTFLIDQKTNIDGTDVGPRLIELFEVLNTSEDRRQRNLDEDLAVFPYIDGNLFSERLSIPSFDSETRKILLDCCHFDWSPVSPAIFGSMFQAVMDQRERHNLGGHYTSEANIMKTINALFLDNLNSEFDRHRSNKAYLKEMLARVGKIKILDPACGCGNFLMISYRELRRLQIRIRKQTLRLEGIHDQRVLDVSNFDDDLNVDSLFGIEIMEFSVRIAQVGLWLMDHLVNLEVSKEFGLYYKRLPLVRTAKIVVGNALRMDWSTIVPQNQLTYVIGNPPFVSKQDRTHEQQEDMDLACEGIDNYGLLDYVSCWYVKASEYIRGTGIQVAFVSTNAITHGEQVGVLWSYLLKNRGLKINFAHRTFRWVNDARGKAHVFVVIIGFALKDTPEKFIFDYETPDSNPVKIKVKRINPYLVDFADVLLRNRNTPICDVSKISYGSMPNDDGNLIFTDKEMREFVEKEPRARKFIHPLMSAKEFLHGEKRWCLWLAEVSPSELRELPEVEGRIKRVREYRKASKREATVKLAEVPYLFGEIRQPNSEYILIPLHTSEARKYIPMAFLTRAEIANNSCSVVPTSDLYYFGILMSLMHMAWVSSVCGRIKGDYRYSNNLVYNNFPFPEKIDEKQRRLVRDAAKGVLQCRKRYSSSSLADLYDPLTMPRDLLGAHRKLDKVVDRLYSRKKMRVDSERLLLLFGLYLKYTNDSGQTTLSEGPG